MPAAPTPTTSPNEARRRQLIDELRQEVAVVIPFSASYEQVEALAHVSLSKLDELASLNAPPRAVYDLADALYIQMADFAVGMSDPPAEHPPDYPWTQAHFVAAWRRVTGAAPSRSPVVSASAITVVDAPGTSASSVPPAIAPRSRLTLTIPPSNMPHRPPIAQSHPSGSAPTAAKRDRPPTSPTNKPSKCSRTIAGTSTAPAEPDGLEEMRGQTKRDDRPRRGLLAQLPEVETAKKPKLGGHKTQGKNTSKHKNKGTARECSPSPVASSSKTQPPTNVAPAKKVAGRRTRHRTVPAHSEGGTNAAESDNEFVLAEELGEVAVAAEGGEEVGPVAAATASLATGTESHADAELGPDEHLNASPPPCFGYPYLLPPNADEVPPAGRSPTSESSDLPRATSEEFNVDAGRPFPPSGFVVGVKGAPPLSRRGPPPGPPSSPLTSRSRSRRDPGPAPAAPAGDVLGRVGSVSVAEEGRMDPDVYETHRALQRVRGPNASPPPAPPSPPTPPSVLRAAVPSIAPFPAPPSLLAPPAVPPPVATPLDSAEAVADASTFAVFPADESAFQRYVSQEVEAFQREFAVQLRASLAQARITRLNCPAGLSCADAIRFRTLEQQHVIFAARSAAYAEMTVAAKRGIQDLLQASCDSLDIATATEAAYSGGRRASGSRRTAATRPPSNGSAGPSQTRTGPHTEVAE